ncbi:WG repeat-containing protein [Lysobacter capsici]|uniref:WG repeat-containing protein n=1 Tax=Lysobacter capsici TaxID=435897 RepID=UPI00287B679A|nr:WG repeat-containing protein [Lysobacter capsici]WND79986.1 WG repeat-containing protein [Lysobacter capsici]WND85182.1 WG repeat-containing protein [Lysobacter capsici]
MRGSPFKSLLALVCAGTLCAPLSAAETAQPAEGALEVFTLNNELTHWAGQGLRDARGRVVVPVDTVEFTRLPGGGWLSRAGLGGELLDAHGKRIAGPFEYIEPPQPSLDAMLIGTEGSPLLGGKGGLVREDGRVVAEPVYTELDALEGTGLFSFQRARRTGAMNAQGRIVLEPLNDSVAAVASLLAVTRRGQSALFDRNGKALTEFRDGVDYAALEGSPWIRECIRPVGEHNGVEIVDEPRCRVLDETAKPAIPGEFAEVDYLPDARRWVAIAYRKAKGSDESAPRYVNRTVLLLDEAGRRVAELQALYIHQTQAARLVVTVATSDGADDREGLADRDGRWLVKPDYDRIETLPIAFAERDGNKAPPQFSTLRWIEGTRSDVGVVDADGRVILPMAEWQVIAHYPSLALYIVKLGDKTGVIDSAGRWRIPAKHSDIAPNSDLPAPYVIFSDTDYSGRGEDRDRYTLYDLRSGKPVFAGDYRYIDPQDSYWPMGVNAPWPEFVIVAAERGGKHGVIDMQGNVVVPFEYYNIDSPDRWGRVTVYRDENDEKGRQVDGLPPQKAARLRDMLSRQIREQQAPVSSVHAPYAGRYVPAQYTDAAQVQAAAQRGALSRPVAPMILMDASTAILDLGMIGNRKGPALDYLEYYCERDNGFDILMPGADVSERACADSKAPRLILQAAGEQDWTCSTCKDYGLPERWRRTDPAPNPNLP